MRKGLVTATILVVIVLGLTFAAQRLLRTSSPASAGEQLLPRDAYRISVQGIVVPARVARLSFPSSGRIAEVMVAVGDQVKEGQVVARQDTTALDLQLELAASNLALQQAKLEQLLGDVSAAELIAAQASYDAALAAQAALKAGPRPEEIAIATASLKRAEVALEQAQAAYDALRNLPDIGARPESLQLQQATLDYEQARAAFDLATAGASESELKEAEGRVASAKAELDKLRGEAPLREAQIAQANVKQAEVALAQAKLALEQALLSAPMAGTVTSIDLTAPEIASAGATVLTIASLDQLQVELTDLDEWALTHISPGQAVELEVPGLANRVLQGRVRWISPEPSTEATGAVSYRSTIELDEQSPGLRWGMTVRLPLKVAAE